MARIPVLFVIGAVVGSAAGYAVTRLHGPGDQELTASPAAAAARSAAGAERTAAPEGASADSSNAASTAAFEAREGALAAAPAPASSFASARLAAFATAAAATDPFELETLLERAAAAPVSRRRDVEIEALLGRLAELDPRRAVEAAQWLELETRFLVPVFGRWAAADAAAAIDELRGIVKPAVLRTLALAVLDTLGNDARNVERVASALPQGDRLAFSIDALAARARRDPSGALEAALALEHDAARTLALRRVAEVAAYDDPQAALAAVEGIEDRALGNAYKFSVLDAWAKEDPSAVLAYLEAAPPSEIPGSTAVFASLAASAPERVLAMLDRLPPTLRSVAQRTAIQAIAQRDPRGALALLEALPPGQDRTMALQSVAQAYGRQAPDAALAWARTQSPARDALSSVVRGIAEVDFDRALDIAIAELESAGNGPNDLAAAQLARSVVFSLISPLGTSEVNFERAADRLLTITSAGAQTLVPTVISRWSQTDSEAALRWVLANAERLPANAFSGLAQRLGETNTALAASTLDQLPPQHRGTWLAGVAAGIANTDPDAALRFIEPYRGLAEYEDAFSYSVTALAARDPAAAARLISSQPSSPVINAVASRTAGNWARSDPAAAARFALSLGDEGARSAASRNVATNWARSDADAARRWVLSLPGGRVRDAALDGYVSSAAASGTFDERALAAYGNDDDRQRAAFGAILQIGNTDPERARTLIAAHLTDPTLRRQAEEQLARFGGSNRSPGVFISEPEFILR